VSGRVHVTGSGLSPIDAKGRVALPPALRNAVISNSEGRSFYLASHQDAVALVGFDAVTLDQMSQRIEASEDAAAAGGLPKFNIAARRDFFATAEPLPFDSSGRFVLSARMRDRGGLQDFAYFVGVGNMFEVWNPQNLLAEPDANPRLLADVRWALKERGL
jgi:MraZ protein